MAFGGGQHAGAVAELLGIGEILVPREAGLLSALGLGAAVVERFAHRQVLATLDDLADDLALQLAELARQASAEVAAEGVEENAIEIRRQVAFLRFAGQETTLEIEVGEARPDPEALAASFGDRYQALYGYRPAARPIEVESLRVVASSRSPDEGRKVP